MFDIGQRVRVRHDLSCASSEAQWLHDAGQPGRVGIVQHHWDMQRPHIDEHVWFVAFPDPLDGQFGSGSSFRDDELEAVEGS